MVSSNQLWQPVSPVFLFSKIVEWEELSFSNQVVNLI